MAGRRDVAGRGREQQAHAGGLPRASLAPFLRQPVSRHYILGVLGDIARITLIVCAAVEGIFLSDLLINVLLPRVLEHRSSVLTLLLLIGVSAPEGLFLSLPVAIVVGCYLTLLRRRETGEFTVLAGMGYGGRLLFTIAAVVGIGFLILSMLLSAFVEPLSRYTRERVLVDMAFQGMSNAEIGAGKFYTMDELTVFLTAGRLVQGADHVFIFQEKANGAQQLMMVNKTEGVKNAAGDPVGLMLDGMTVVNYATTEVADPRCAECRRQTIVPANYNVIDRLFVKLPKISGPDPGQRGDNINNNTTIELLLQLDRKDARELVGQRLLRSLLCMLAPIIALLAVAMTRPATQLVAMPAAAGLVLAFSFFGPRAVAAASDLPLGVTVILLLGATGLAAWVMQIATMRREAAALRLARVSL